MKFPKLTFVFPIVAVILIAVLEHAKSSELSNTENLSNADLNHLISILDNEGKTAGTNDKSTSVTKSNDSQVQVVKNTQIPPKTTIIKKRIKIRKVLTTSTSTTPKPIDFTTSESSSTTPKQESLSKATFVPTISRREDSNIETLKEITPPSQQELVQQLSLLNSLLTSLGDNATSTESPKPEVKSTTTESTLTYSKVSNPPISNEEQTLAALSSIFAGRGSSRDSSVEDVAAALLGLGPSTSSNVVPRQTNSNAVDTEAAKALSDFLLQASAIENQKSPQKNIPDTASNQISSLVSLLGTLNSISPQSEQQGDLLSQLGLGQNSQIHGNNHQLSNLLGSQRQQKHAQQQPNSLSELFNQPQSSSAFNFGNLLGSQVHGLSGIGGIGSGILSSLGSFGSSIFSTVSNVLTGSGLGGKPRVRGLDTRMGLGYRFGDAADAQIMWDVGPQIFTDPIKNEDRSSTIMTSNGHNEKPPGNTRAEKATGAIASVKRILQSQMQRGMQTHHLNQLQFTPSAATPIAAKKPLSLLDIWNVGKESQSTGKVSSALDIPDQLLTPPLAIGINEADEFQILRDKSFRKRSSTSLKNYYSKPFDDPFSGHSTLTEYEKMLLNEGKDVAAKFVEDIDEEDRPRQSTRRRKPRPPTRAQEELPEPEYGNDSGLSGSAPIPKKSQKPFKEERPRRPLKPRRRRPLKKWNPRIRDESEEKENYRDRDYDEQDGSPRSRSKERQTEESFRFREDENRRRESQEERMLNRHKNRGHSGEYKNKQRYSESRERPDKRPSPSLDDFNYVPPHLQEPESSNSDAKPIFNYNPNDDDVNDHDVDNDNPRPDSKPFEGTGNGPQEKPYDDGSEDYGPPRSRPKPIHDDFKEVNDHKHHTEHKPKSHPKSKKKPLHSTYYVVKENPRPKPKFSLSKIFHYWVRKAHGIGIEKPKSEPCNKEGDDEAYERFTYKEPSLREKGFQARNKKRQHKLSDRSFNHKISRNGGIPYDYYQTYEPEINPEANDSFLRRNQVTVRPKLRDSEKQTGEHQGQETSHSPSYLPPAKSYQTKPNSVMSFVRNYLSPKSGIKSSHTQLKNTPSPRPSISTLSQLLSNPSALNPLKILPIRRKQHLPKRIRTKLTPVDGKLQVVNSTTSTTTEVPKPIIHIGDDMSFEELTKVLTSVKNQGNKKIKLKIKKKKPEVAPQRRKDQDYDDDNEDQDNLEEAESIAAEQVVKVPGKKKTPVAEEDYDENDGLKGIFIDIESGEVDVLKPVASLTSFAPTTEPPPPPPVLEDEYEDADGDGVADTEMRRKQEIFSDIQKELKQNYDKMKKAHERAEAKQRRKEVLVSKGLDESVDVVSKYFDMVNEKDHDDDEEAEGEE